MAGGNYSHAEGYGARAAGAGSHAEGYDTAAGGASSHAEGESTEAGGASSHAEGCDTAASGASSHAEGFATQANHRSQHVFGEYNAPDSSEAAAGARGNYVEIVGNGTGSSARSNARTLDWSGNEALAGRLTLGAGPSAAMDAATKQYVDAQTASPLLWRPAVDASGTLSWSRSAVTETPAAQNIRGPQGVQGQPGAAGQTPVKGTDYWTAADRAEMVADVLAALTNAEEVAY